jgi:hypothetical protein
MLVGNDVNAVVALFGGVFDQSEARADLNSNVASSCAQNGDDNNTSVDWRVYKQAFALLILSECSRRLREDVHAVRDAVPMISMRFSMLQSV